MSAAVADQLTVPAQVGPVERQRKKELAAVEEAERQDKQGEWRRRQVPHAANNICRRSMIRASAAGLH